MWFWDIHNDAYKSADSAKYLYITAANKLGANPVPTLLQLLVDVVHELPREIIVRLILQVVW
jgi:hypothetical protein